MSSQVFILGISGSLRRDSYNSALLDIATQHGLKDVRLEVESLASIPLYNKDIEDQGMPESVRLLRERIGAADALLIVTPEYNHSIPGVLKNTIDWVSRPPHQPFNGKPVALMGGGGSAGTANAQTHLGEVVKALKMYLLDRSSVTVSSVWKKFDATHQLIDETVRTSIIDHVAALAEFTRELHDT